MASDSDCSLWTPALPGVHLRDFPDEALPQLLSLSLCVLEAGGGGLEGIVGCGHIEAGADLLGR